MPWAVRNTSSGHCDLVGLTGPKVHAVAGVDNTRKGGEVIKCL